MSKWEPQVYFEKSQKHPYIAYAVHTNGKVELAGHRSDFQSAVLCADELSNMLNRYHRYGGKYKGKDKLIGERVEHEKVKKELDFWHEKTKIFMKRHKEIFGDK
jgi:hypothetical protein